MKTHEYAEAVSEQRLEAAARWVRAQRGQADQDILLERATEAVEMFLCPCVTDAEDAAEGHVSDIHTALIAEVARRAQAGH
ncbi:MAG: hypothetical protein ACREFJ_06770 [Acetobacteraceae bacterium]